MNIDRGKTLGLTQSGILFISIIAFAFIIGSGIPTVSAGGLGEVCKIGGCQEGLICANSAGLSVIGEEQGTCQEAKTEQSSGVCFEEGGKQKAIGTECGPGLICNDQGQCIPKPQGGEAETSSSKTQTKGNEPSYGKEIVESVLTETLTGKAKQGLDGIIKKLFPTGKEKVTEKAIEETVKEAGETLSKEAIKSLRFEKLVAEGTKGQKLWYYLTHTKGVSEMGSFAKITGSYLASLAAAAVIWTVFKLAGASDRNMREVTQAGIAAVAIAGSVGAITVLGGPLTMAITAGIMGIWIAFTYQNYSQEVFTYQVQTWQPPSGGENCEQCNSLRYGCSEYQCHSFGKSCDLINKGTTDELCIWKNKDDIKGPELIPLESALPNEEDYMYIESEATLPGARGAKIVYKPNNDGCIPPFTSISFGVESDEPAECKIDTIRKNNLSSMVSYMLEGAYLTYEHTLFLPSSGMPSQEGLESIGSITSGEDYNFFIRCQDSNGNPTTANFLMEFCVDDGPDTMAPIIEGTNYIQESYIGFNQTEIPLEVYTNEPADCRWDFQDLDYEIMNNQMQDCSQTIEDYLNPITFSYGCRSTLTGIKEGEENNYYIRCKDKPWLENSNQTIGKRFANTDSYTLSLIGTYPLQIDEITINGEETGTTIIDSTNTVKTTINVKTSAGANEGKSKCQYGIDGYFYDFFNDGSFNFQYENTQDFFLPQGYYNYQIKCIDEAGNSAEELINFTIELDEESPIVVRAYYEEGYLKLITNEDATCVYSTDTCNYAYEDGIELDTNDGFNHFVNWNTEFNLYVKCKDLFGNLPILQEDCSFVVRAFE